MSDNENESEKRETVADILAEMHKESKKERTVTRPDGYGGYEKITLEGNPYLKNLADRIEAAIERDRTSRHSIKIPIEVVPELVGNAAALREALEFVREKLYTLDCYGEFERGVYELACEAIDRALAAPPRNCDVGTAEEQTKRMHDEYCSHCECYVIPSDAEPYGCPLYEQGVDCRLKWAQMPYAEEGAEHGKA